MWLFTTAGFFGVIQEPGHPHLTVRARSREELDRLRAAYLPALGPTFTEPGSEAPFGARVPKADFAIALLELARSIDYASFEDALTASMGAAHAETWRGVRGALPPAAPEAAAPPAPRPVEPPRPAPVETWTTQEIVLPKADAPVYCEVCGLPGHTRRACPTFA